MIHTVTRTGLPRERNWPGRRIRVRKHCACRCRLLGMVLESSGHFDGAARKIGRDSSRNYLTVAEYGLQNNLFYIYLQESSFNIFNTACECVYLNMQKKVEITIDWDPERLWAEALVGCPTGGPIVPEWPFPGWGKVWNCIALLGSISSRNPSRWKVAYGQISSSIPANGRSTRVDSAAMNGKSTRLYWTIKIVIKIASRV